MCCSATSSHKPGTRCLEKIRALKSQSSVAQRTSFHPLPAASDRNERLDFCHLHPLLSILILTFHKPFFKSNHSGLSNGMSWFTCRWGYAVRMVENTPGNSGLSTKQCNSAAALIPVAHRFSCSSPSCLLLGGGKPAS